MPEVSGEFAGLVERARAGEEAALAGLAQKYEAEVRLVARVLLGPALRPYLDSVDLVQSVHKSLLLGFRQDRFDISSPEKLIALALTVVRRKVARHWRHLQRQKRLESGGGDTPELEETLTAFHPDADPARAAEHRDNVRHFCSRLNPTERRMIELRLHGFSSAEVARELGVDADVLRVRLSRLRQRLRADGVLDEWL